MAAGFIGLVPLCSGQLFTNTVEKVYDLSFGQDLSGNLFGGYAPCCKPVQVGTNLLFTTSKGGFYNNGTISSFSLVSHQYNHIAYLSGKDGQQHRWHAL